MGLQTWAASLNMEGDLLKDAGASDHDGMLKNEKVMKHTEHLWAPDYVWPGSSGHVWYPLVPLLQTVISSDFDLRPPQEQRSESICESHLLH